MIMTMIIITIYGKKTASYQRGLRLVSSSRQQKHARLPNWVVQMLFQSLFRIQTKWLSKSLSLISIQQYFASERISHNKRSLNLNFPFHFSNMQTSTSARGENASAWKIRPKNHDLVGLHFLVCKLRHNHTWSKVFDIIHPVTSFNNQKANYNL